MSATDPTASQLILPDGTTYEGRLQYNDDGTPLVITATCGHCGFTWNDALMTSLTPAPAGRCPNEFNHEYDEEDEMDTTEMYRRTDDEFAEQILDAEIARGEYESSDEAQERAAGMATQRATVEEKAMAWDRLMQDRSQRPDHESLLDAWEWLRDRVLEREADDVRVSGYCITARELGVEAAKAAASWVADGNSDSAGIARLLAMIEDGDPEMDEHLPRVPNLSGEFADDPTALSLAREITGEEDPDPDLVDALATAWEEGVQETFETACEAELRSHL